MKWYYWVVIVVVAGLIILLSAIVMTKQQLSQVNDGSFCPKIPKDVENPENNLVGIWRSDEGLHALTLVMGNKGKSSVTLEGAFPEVYTDCYRYVLIDNSHIKVITPDGYEDVLEYDLYSQERMLRITGIDGDETVYLKTDEPSGKKRRQASLGAGNF